jgi:stalled ribosome rescue protein Dom34
VERVIIYNEKQSEDDDDDAEVIVKIFVEFSQMSGKIVIFRCNA